MIFLNQSFIDAGTFGVAAPTNSSLAAGLTALDEQLDVTVPGAVANVQAAATALVSEADQFKFDSLSPSFDITATSGLGGESVITDWDGLASDIVIDADVSVGAWTWTGSTGKFTATNAVNGHISNMSFEFDAEKGAGAGVRWQFSVRINGGVPVISRITKNFDVLNDRLAFRVTFPLLAIPSAGTTVEFLAQPESGGASTLTIYKFVPVFLRHTN